MGNGNSKDNKLPATFTNIFAFIESSIKNSKLVNVKIIARHFKVTPRWINKTIHKELGIPPKTFLYHLYGSYIARYMKHHKGQLVKQAGYALGINNKTTLLNICKSFFKKSPAELNKIISSPR